jgi:translation initiation factor RLI1
MKDLVLVVHEYDYEFKEHSVIGLFSSLDAAQKGIEEYYGEYTQKEYVDIRDSGLEYSMTIYAHQTAQEYKLVAEWFNIDEI